MFGSLAKDTLPAELGVAREDLVLVSVMPCTAKKSEARRGGIRRGGEPDVDFVLTTQELARMIQDAGIPLGELDPRAWTSRSASRPAPASSSAIPAGSPRRCSGTWPGCWAPDRSGKVRGSGGRRSVTLELPGGPVRIGIVHGLAHARALVQDVREGREHYDFVEVMACPGGCAGGAGQPVALDRTVRQRRAEQLRRIDAGMDLRVPSQNALVTKAYQERLGFPNSSRAHRLLHTRYSTRRRSPGDGIALTEGGGARVPVSVCVGTSCHLRGWQASCRTCCATWRTGELARPGGRPRHLLPGSLRPGPHGEGGRHGAAPGRPGRRQGPAGAGPGGRSGPRGRPCRP